ncbi:transmembrane protein-like protein isoform X2 [Tasmannia lanceolata]
MQPMMCFQYGSPPLPDASENYLDDLVLNSLFNGSIGGMQNGQGAEQCFFFQKNKTITMTNEQISPGVWYIGFFNGIGPARTQSKMISRGPAYMFSSEISVKGCLTSTIWGPYCNQTINLLSCAQDDIYTHPRSLLNLEMSNGGAHFNYAIKSRDYLPPNSSLLYGPNSNVITCKNSLEAACLGTGELKTYTLEIVSTTLQLKIMAKDVRFNQPSTTNNTESTDEIVIMCYARHNAMPMTTLHDYSIDISRVPLIIQLPKIGRWYVAILVDNHTNVQGVPRNLCFSLEWQIHGCLLGKAGPNCTWEKHMLQRVLRESAFLPYESYYLPIGENTANFPLEPLLSNSSFEEKLVAWTYFILDIPHGATGGNLHVQLTSDAKIDYGIYARFGGLPSLDTWDHYVNGTSSSNGSMFLALNESSSRNVNLYILYPREGTWIFGFRHPVSIPFRDQINMHIALEGCPRQCSSHGTCHSGADGSGLTLYSYCSCDRDHGGFDCGIELVTHAGHMWQSIALIASNAAAILPAFWALRQKAFSEWVLFTSSGVSSGLYHACDVGTWCALSFRVLQFMDFWLSFMAVVSTFVYMATIDEVSKRAIHTTVAILTALMASTSATRSANIFFVIAIGTLGLLIGLMIEFSTSIRSIYCSPRFRLNIPERWQNIRRWLYNLVKTLRQRFRWDFIILGFIALFAAGLSWKLESSQSYWIWHSLWHVTIYTSSFFFLCSTIVKNNERCSETEYELTRQNSFPRGEGVESADLAPVIRV